MSMINGERIVNILYIERTNFPPAALEDYKLFIAEIFQAMGYGTNIVSYCDTPDKDKIDKIINENDIDVMFIDITLGSRMAENYLGLENIRTLKINYPEIVICGISGKTINYRMTSARQNIPTFDLFVDKLRHDDEDYKEYIKQEMSRVFSSNVGIDIDFHNLPEKEKKFVSQPFFKRLLKRITFTTHTSNFKTNIKHIELFSTSGGYSSSHVYKMRCTTENGSLVINSVLKCSEIDANKNINNALQEVNNYLNYVKWYLPYTWRPEMLSFALGRDWGMICYSFVYNDDVPFYSLTDKIKQGEFEKVDVAIENIFDDSHKQWYSTNNRGFVEKSINRFYRDMYFPLDRNKPFQKVIDTLRVVGGSCVEDRYQFGTTLFPTAESLFVNPITNRYRESICHGDLNTNNIQITDKNELIFIDFQDAGKGHVFHDFVVFEMCLRLYNPSSALSFNALLHNEILLCNGGDNENSDPLWSRIKKVRFLAENNFPEEDFNTYYVSLAMRSFRLFRSFDCNRYEAQILLAVLLANLQKLEQLEKQPVPQQSLKAPKRNHSNSSTITLPVLQAYHQDTEGLVACAEAPNFKIGVSFTGFYRKAIVEPVVNSLLYGGFTKNEIFYDDWHDHLFNGIDGDLVIRNIYSQKCDFLVVFMSKDYDTRRWPGGVEWRAIRTIINELAKRKQLCFAILSALPIKSAQSTRDDIPAYVQKGCL